MLTTDLHQEQPQHQHNHQLQEETSQLGHHNSNLQITKTFKLTSTKGPSNLNNSLRNSRKDSLLNNLKGSLSNSLLSSLKDSNPNNNSLNSLNKISTKV